MANVNILSSRAEYRYCIRPLIAAGLLLVNLVGLNVVHAAANEDVKESMAMGAAWLISEQEVDGSWRGDLGDEMSVITTSYAALGLHLAMVERGDHDIPSYPVSRAQSWLLGKKPKTLDATVMQILALSNYNPPDNLVNRLEQFKVTFQNDGENVQGFGKFSKKYLSSRDTLTAALVCFGFDTQQTVVDCLGIHKFYMDYQGRVDGGGLPAALSDKWLSFKDKLSAENIHVMPDVITTAFESRLASVLYSHSSQKSTEWLLANQNNDGGFGNGKSNIFETAVVLDVLHLWTIENYSFSSAVKTAIANAENYLINAQLENGSWQNSELLTGAALKALRKVIITYPYSYPEPDRALADSDSDGIPDRVEELLGTDPQIANVDIDIQGKSQSYPPATWLWEAEMGYQTTFVLPAFASESDITWKLISGKLPEGMKLVNNTISGSSNKRGKYQATVLAVDAELNRQTHIIEISVNYADSDADGDGIPLWFEARYGLNSLNANDRDLDNDHDGLTNFQEYSLGTLPNDSDTDGDNVSDSEEIALGLDATDPGDGGIAFVDSDNDGLTGLQEFRLGTDPYLFDSDADGMGDGDEVDVGRNPLLNEPAILVVIQSILL